MNPRCSWYGRQRIPAATVVSGAVVLLYGYCGLADPSQGTGDPVDADRRGPGSPCTCTEILGTALENPALASRTLVLARPGDTLSISLSELASSALCVQGPGGFSTTTGKTITGTWAGVSVPDLLVRWAGLQDDHSVTFTADDGYRMSFTGREILDRSQGTWIVAALHDDAPIPPEAGVIRTIKVGPSNPLVTGHLSVQRLHAIAISGVPAQPYAVAMRGRMHVDVDSQTLQSCASCHGSKVRMASAADSSEYWGVPLFRLLSFSDDSLYAPHRQDSATPSYQRDLARLGYGVDVVNLEGTSVSLDSRNLDGRPRTILALYRDGNDLPSDAAPVLVVAPDEGVVPAAPSAVLHGVRTVLLQIRELRGEGEAGDQHRVP